MTDVSTVQQMPPKEHPLVVIRRFLDSRAAELKMALPAHISPERFIRVVITAIQRNPDIAACDRQTLWNACLMCAADGLLPNSEEAALVAYKTRAQYLPMYQGLLKKFRNSGEFKHINAYVVYEGEPFEHWIDESGEHFKHTPGDERDEKRMRRVYATATTKDGGVFMADLSLNEINKRKAMSRTSRDDAPWRSWPEEMAKKTAIKALAKFLPKSSDIDVLLQRDEAALTSVEAVDDRRQAVSAGETMSALERFAQEDDHEKAHPQDQGAPAAPAEKTDPAQSAPETTDDPPEVIEAYERGKFDRRKGMQKRATPVEYRNNEKTAEMAAWLRGWDDGEK